MSTQDKINHDDPHGEAFILFGDRAESIMFDDGFEAVKELMEEEDEGELYHWRPGITTIADLLSNFIGNSGYVFLTKDQYNELAELKGLHKIED